MNRAITTVGIGVALLAAFGVTKAVFDSDNTLTPKTKTLAGVIGLTCFGAVVGGLFFVENGP